MTLVKDQKNSCIKYNGSLKKTLISIGTNLIGAAQDGVIQSVKEYQDYAELVVGLRDYNEYFNAGIMIIGKPRP